jgi:hypothetical protein
MDLWCTKFTKKKNHTEKYLHAKAHHHPTQKLGVINTLNTKALKISNEDHFKEDKIHKLEFFKNNRYNKRE